VMDGYTATAALREQGFTLPIIALTAYAMAEDRKKCMASGCTDYLSKPIDRELLLKTVSQHLTEIAPASVTDSPGIRSRLRGFPGMNPIIIEFVAGLPDRVRQLTDCLQRKDLDGLGHIVHQLRGAGGSYGFDDVTAPATQAEESIRNGESMEAITREVDSLVAIVRRIDGFDQLKKCQSAPAEPGAMSAA
jgi:HPt (histidine-containing phosphotransfer) domain-containing protein